MEKKYEFQTNILGSNNGLDVKEYHKGQIIEKQELAEELFNAWLKREVIKEVGKKDKVEDKEKEKEKEEEDKQNLDNIPVPDDAEEITKEEAKKLLIIEVKKLLEENPINTDKLKEYGIQLDIKNMANTVNPDTILKKVKDYLAKEEEVKE